MSISKKIILFSLISLVLLSLIATFAISQTADDAAAATKGAIVGGGQAVQTLLGPLFGQREMLTRFFFAILLGMIIYSIVGIVFKGRKTTSLIITIVITLLSLLWMPSNFLQAIRSQYEAMGGAILAAIPFLIILIFSLRVGNPLIGRITWILYVIYYFTLLIYRMATSSVSFLSAENIPYIGAIIGGLVIFFLMSTIRNAIFKGDMKGIKEAGEQTIQSAGLLHRLQKEELDMYGEKSGNK